jgi:hypothetical protein
VQVQALGQELELEQVQALVPMAPPPAAPMLA